MADGKDVSATGTAAAQQMDQLLKLFGGGKVTTTTQGNTSGLDAVMQQLQAKSGTDQAAIMATLMQQFAGKIPQVNATGAASGGRTPTGMMNGQMQKLLAGAIVAAQQQIAQQESENLRTQASVADSQARNSSKQTQVQTAGGGPLLQLQQLAGLNKGIKSMTGFDPAETLIRKGRSMLGFENPGAVSQYDPLWSSITSAPQSPLNLMESFSLGNVAPSITPSVANIPLDLGSLMAPASLDTALTAMNTGIEFGAPTAASTGSFLSGDAAAGTVSPAGASSGWASAAPWFAAASLLANPQSISDAVELGEGNVTKDVSELYNVGLAGTTIAAASGSALAAQALAALGPWAAPIAIVLGGISTFTDEEPDHVTWYNEIKGMMDGENSLNMMTGEKAGFNNTSDLELANYFYTRGGGAWDTYGQYMSPRVQSLYAKLGENYGNSYSLMPGADYAAKLQWGLDKSQELGLNSSTDVTAWQEGGSPSSALLASLYQDDAVSAEDLNYALTGQGYWTSFDRYHAAANPNTG